MKRLSAFLAVLATLFLVPLAAPGAENATVTEDAIPLMKGPSFIVEEVPGFATAKGQRIEVISRTSFTDYLAAVPENYWYLVPLGRGAAPVTGYIHGSVLIIDPGVTVPVFDPPGFTPKPKVVSGGYAVTSAISERCVKTEGSLTVPNGSTATHFTIARFDSSFTPCSGNEYGSIIGFSIVSATDTGREFFSYEEHIADDPAGLQHMKDGFYYLDLDPGRYTVTIRGGPGTVLELSYELVRAR